jgi:hypothetical protein
MKKNFFPYYFVVFLIFLKIYECKPNGEETANFICNTVLNNKTFSYENIFDESVVKIMPYSNFKEAINEVLYATGYCKSYSPNPDGYYNFTSSSGDVAIIGFHLNSNFLIDSFLIKNVVLESMLIKNFVDAMNYASYFVDGVISLSINVRNGTSKSFQNSPRHPIGSGFKLYVLGTLINQVKEGLINWSDIKTLNSDYYSLPSGILQTKPNGTQISVYDLAAYMINISDNTATDHLINFLKRESVESQLALMKNSLIDSNTPFLKTSDLFKLKWVINKTKLDRYLQMTNLEKRIFLTNEINQVSLKNVTPAARPLYIDSVEWFASTDDLCFAMFYILDQNSTEALNILGQNTPFIDKEIYDYAGFKGGSEPGVYSFTYLLRNKKSQKWGCVSMAYFDTKKNLNSWVTYNYLQRLINFIGPYFAQAIAVKISYILLIICFIFLI